MIIEMILIIVIIEMILIENAGNCRLVSFYQDTRKNSSTIELVLL